jgi:RimJ/RimL family protein N-acetyltransferase
MFARTERLTLRHGWIEDAPALARAIAHESVAMKLARLPWPYTLKDAEAWLSPPRGVGDPNLLIFRHKDGATALVGGIGLDMAGEHGPELGYWITPAAWGRGYASEAGRAVLEIARQTLGLRRIVSGHFVDNPASGRVLAKLGFRATGHVEQRHCVARRTRVPCATYELELGAEVGRPRMAA